MKCEECSHTLFPEAKFCPHCEVTIQHQEAVKQRRSRYKSIALDFLMSKVVGISQPLEIPFKEVFSHVFAKHSEEEGEKLFLVGTSETTPKIENVLDSWPKPWLFARIFLIIGFLYIGLFIGFEIFDNANFFPGLIMVGSFIVPLTILIFFWEMNAPQNISIYKIIKILFIGGIMSLVTAVFFYKNIGDNTSVIMIGIVEEVAKLFVILWFIRGRKYTFILNGVLIGAAVGTGFAAFESAGYALRSVLLSDFDTMYYTIFWRGVLSPGGHIVWAALTGGAICLVRGARAFQFIMLFNTRFLRIFMMVVAMHAVWDLPWPSFMSIPIAQLCLTVISWMIAFSVMSLGLKEITKLKILKEQQIINDIHFSNSFYQTGGDL